MRYESPFLFVPSDVASLDQKLLQQDLVFRVLRTSLPGILSGMASHAERISQPGRTGNVEVLRIVKAARRTSSSVDPVGYRSMAASSRTVSSPRGSLALRFLRPASVGLRSIETGGSKLAQGQIPCAFPGHDAPCKSRQSCLRGSDIESGVVRKRLIRGRRKVDRAETSGGRRHALQSSVLLSERDSRAVERKRPSATGASSGSILNTFRIDPGQRRGARASCRYISLKESRRTLKINCIDIETT